MNVRDVRLRQGNATKFIGPEARVMALVVRGEVHVNGPQIAREAQLAVLDHMGYRDSKSRPTTTLHC